MNDNSTYKQLPAGNSHHCFGCSMNNSHGLQMKFYTNETSVLSDISVPEHMCGWNKLVHGGILSVILDEIMSWSVLYILKKMVLTKSMTVDYVKPVSIHQELTAEGKPVNIIGRHEVLVEGVVYDSTGDICAKSNGNFALLTPKIAKRMGIVDEDALKGIEKIINT